VLAAGHHCEEGVSVQLHRGDCREIMELFLADESVDSIVTDPPYGLSFMGKGWDHGVPDVSFWREAYRVLKPGGYLLAFGGSRTYHRLVCPIEDAGFEIRDQIMWVYGSGFPKSHNLEGDWEGWGTALKPAHEPIAVARKPLAKGHTVAANVLAHGTGAMNIDRCRVGDANQFGESAWAAAGKLRKTSFADFVGRWPANLIHDGSPEVVAAFPQAAGQLADASSSSSSSSRKTQNVYGAMRRGRGEEPSAESDNSGAVGFKMKPGTRRLDEGSAARFFYCAKASRADRNDGCDAIAAKPLNWSSGTQNPGSFQSAGTDRSSANHHPTVKPTALMQYLLRLVTPPGGLTLDMFMGSGSTGRGAVLEGFDFIGIEKDEDEHGLPLGYFDIAKARIGAAAE
jgi:DNA modification methylase